MMLERLPITRMSSGLPDLTASATLGSWLSVASRLAGTSQAGDAAGLAEGLTEGLTEGAGAASSPRAEGAASVPHSRIRLRRTFAFISPLPLDRRCRGRFWFSPPSCQPRPYT